jgi:hypothetical protein
LTDIDNNSSFTDGYGQIWRKPAPVDTSREFVFFIYIRNSFFYFYLFSRDLAVAIHNEERRQYHQVQQQQQPPRYSQGYYPEQSSRKSQKKHKRPSYEDDDHSSCILS